MKKSRGPYVQLKTDARIISKHLKRNIIILDVNREAILTISSHDIRDNIELIYYPPSPLYPGGHFDAYVKGEVVKAFRFFEDDYFLLYSAIKVAGDYTVRDLQRFFNTYIEENPSDAGRLITNNAYAYQLKRGRALLRLDMNPPTRKMNPCELNSSQHFNCIKQASKSENVSRLAKFLAECESESRSAAVNSSERGTVVKSPVSRDACTLFLSSGSSDEAEVYRQCVVGRINEGDITTALKLCCIGHQIPFCQEQIGSIRPISNAQTLRDTSEYMLNMESYEQERSTFLSICDEWCRVLEPRGLMNIEQRELLREWISTRQYANTEDPIVSLVIEKCSEPKKKKEEEKKEEEKKREKKGKKQRR